MNLCLDIGNTKTKAAVFNGQDLIWSGIVDSEDHLSQVIRDHGISNVAVSSVTTKADIPKQLRNLPTLVLDYRSKLPIKLKYLTPETLGADRICAAVGGSAHYPKCNVLTIDIGTCIKYEAVSDAGEHLGGNISPGLGMRYTALNNQTAALPLIKPSARTNDLGLTTEEAIRNGVQLGILCELEAMIDRLGTLLPNLKVVLTGGDHHYFENDLKTPIFAHPLLVLEGLNEILLFNQQN